MHEESALPTFITQRVDGAELAVHVTPRSSKSGIGPVESEAVRVRVSATAVDGAANAALIRLLAEAVHVPKATVEIVAGKTSRRKRVLFRGLKSMELLQRLGLNRDDV
jgi:uncharacterized protein (TIGR00251 family)